MSDEKYPYVNHMNIRHRVDSARTRTTAGVHSSDQEDDTCVCDDRATGMISIKRRIINRLRTFVTIGVMTLLLPGMALRAQTAVARDALRSEFLFQFTLKTQAPHTVGFPGGDRVIVSVSGGTFEGPKLKGTIANSGGDWIVVRPDGSRRLDVRIVFLTDDGEKIFVTWRGIAYTGEDGVLIARIAPLFETNSKKYAWLNNVVAVGVYQPVNNRITYKVYQIL